jgi:murein tripeptide amidase MpaA
MKNLLKVLFMAIPTILSAGNLNIQKYYDEFPQYVLTPVNLMEMKHEFVVEKMHYIHKLNSHIISEEVGRSVEGRSINMFSFGSGKTKLLLWSQMHGDEATATAGLLSVFYFIAQNFDSPFVQSIYNNLSIHAIVMLNPDG